MDGTGAPAECFEKALLYTCLGRQLLGIRRMFYVYRDVTDRSNGALEFWFDQDRLLFLDGGPEGETLVVSDKKWNDPFERAQTDEDRRWIAEHGKWAAFDVTTDPEYSYLVGATLNAVQVLRNQWDRIVGLRSVFGPYVIDVINGADQTIVIPDPDDMTLGRYRAHLAETIALSA
jgi:hypothetical protein